MKQTIYGIVGHTGKLGSLLLERPNFIPIKCDVTKLGDVEVSYTPEIDVVVNCAAISHIEECQDNPKVAHVVNVRGANNLMQVYGKRVLNLSSDYVFSGWSLFPPHETSTMMPINVYGMTKMVMEDLALKTFGAKVIRLSRSIHPDDYDLLPLSWAPSYGSVDAPDFLYRSYLTRNQVVDGIEYFAQNFDQMPGTVNYGSMYTVSFYDLVQELAKVGNLQSYSVERRSEYHSKGAPRPKKAGLNTKLAKSLGFPMYTLDDVAQDFWKGK